MEICINCYAGTSSDVTGDLNGVIGPLCDDCATWSSATIVTDDPLRPSAAAAAVRLLASLLVPRWYQLRLEAGVQPSQYCGFAELFWALKRCKARGLKVTEILDVSVQAAIMTLEDPFTVGTCAGCGNAPFGHPPTAECEGASASVITEMFSELVAPATEVTA